MFLSGKLKMFLYKTCQKRYLFRQVLCYNPSIEGSRRTKKRLAAGNFGSGVDDMALRELTKEYLTKAVYHTPLEIVRLMAEALPLQEGTVLDICGGSEDFLLRAAAMKQKKSEEELLIFENWTGTEDTSDGRENLLVCGPADKAANHLKKEKGKKSEEKTFDAVLMNPPFGYTKGEKKGRVRLESQFLTQAADCVAENGHCAAVVPGGLLNRTAVEDVELRKRFVEKFHVEQVILLPISAFLPYAEVRTGIFIFAKEKGDGMTRFYDLRKVEPENRKLLPEIYQRSEPVCVLNRTTLSEHQYILSTEEYLGEEKADERALISRERILRRQLSRLSEKLPSVYENELGQIGMFPCQKGIQTRKAVIKEILECEYGLLECALLKAAGKEKWPEKEGNTFLKIWSGQRLDEEEKDGPYRVYGAAGVQGSARTATMKEEQAILIGRVGSYCGAVYKAWTKGFVSDNVMLAGAVEEEAEEDFLLLVLRAAHFNVEKRGSVQPYITKDIILKRKYYLPELARQQKFLLENQEIFEKIREQEKEVEELSVESDRLRS